MLSLRPCCESGISIKVLIWKALVFLEFLNCVCIVTNVIFEWMYLSFASARNHACERISCSFALGTCTVGGVSQSRSVSHLCRCFCLVQCMTRKPVRWIVVLNPDKIPFWCLTWSLALFWNIFTERKNKTDTNLIQVVTDSGCRGDLVWLPIDDSLGPWLPLIARFDKRSW
jgi:hypothetical protein